MISVNQAKKFLLNLEKRQDIIGEYAKLFLSYEWNSLPFRIRYSLTHFGVLDYLELVAETLDDRTYREENADQFISDIGKEFKFSSKDW